MFKGLICRWLRDLVKGNWGLGSGGGGVCGMLLNFSSPSPLFIFLSFHLFFFRLFFTFFSFFCFCFHELHLTAALWTFPPSPHTFSPLLGLSSPLFPSSTSLSSPRGLQDMAWLVSPGVIILSWGISSKASR